MLILLFLFACTPASSDIDTETPLVDETDTPNDVAVDTDEVEDTDTGAPGDTDTVPIDTADTDVPVDTDTGPDPITLDVDLRCNVYFGDEQIDIFVTPSQPVTAITCTLNQNTVEVTVPLVHDYAWRAVVFGSTTGIDGCMNINAVCWVP